MRRLRDLAGVVMAGFLAYGTYWLWGSPVWHWQGQMSVSGNRLVSLLEGGYDLQGLAFSVAAHVRRLMNG